MVVTSNFTVVIKTEGFLNLEAKEVSDWVSRDDIIIGVDEEVLNGIVKWMSYDKSEREAHFTELLHHICLQSPGSTPRRGVVLPEKLGRGVWPASQNPYPIYDQNLRFPLPYL